jgi:hypothetical protein
VEVEGQALRLLKGPAGLAAEEMEQILQGFRLKTGTQTRAEAAAELQT